VIYKNLNIDKALIWRIVHRENLSWILMNGLHSSSSKVVAPNYVNIGNSDLIDKRRFRSVPVGPMGYLADYVPFYFTPFSVMMKNINSGRGVKKRGNDEIVILVSSLHKIKKMGLDFVFTNAHAYPSWTEYYTDLNKLQEIDWELLQRRDFKRDEDDPRKMERYQAEALVHKHVPVEALLGVVCYTEQLQKEIEAMIEKCDLQVPVYARKGWYF